MGDEAALFKAIGSSVEALPERDIPAFARWVSQYPAKRVRIFPPAKITSYQGLRPRSFLATSNLSKQLRWVTEFVRQHAASVRVFLEMLESYETAFLSGDCKTTKAALDAIEDKTGLSIWLIEARILALQRFEGLEAQKNYCRSIHEAIPGTIAAYLANYVGQRHEESVSLERFAATVRPRIERQPVSDGVKSFLRARLVGRVLASADEAEICSSMAVGSAFSVIDAYEAVVEAAQEVLRGRAANDNLVAIRHCLDSLEIDDWRLSKLRALVDGDLSGLPLVDTSADDLLLQGRSGEAAARALLEATKYRLNIDALALLATAKSMGATSFPSDGLSSVQREILDLLEMLQTRNTSVEKAADDLSKLSLNMKSLRIAGAIAGHLAFAWLDHPQVHECPATAVFQSTPFLNPRYWMVLPDHVADELVRRSVNVDEPGLTAVVSEAQFSGRPIVDSRLPEEAVQDLTAASAFFHLDFERALLCAEALSHSQREFWRKQSMTLELNCLIATGSLDLAIERTANLCCENYSLRHILPLRALLSGRRWRDVKHLSSSIATPIVFDLYIRTVGGTEHGTNRRIAYDEFLRAHNLQRPSELAAIAPKFPRSQLVYFLWAVCIPEVMDVSFRAYPTSRAIEEERIKVCSLLSDLNPENASVYSDEVKNRTKYLSIADGLRDVDRSRVYVNSDAVVGWAEREIKENFIRYKELLRARIGFSSPDDFDAALRKIREGDQSVMRSLLKYPEQEGDELLIEMFESIKKEYLTNSDYGLDAYLSMRIRHGSLAGYLRSPLEERHLIVLKDESSGQYSDNLDLLGDLGLRSSGEGPRIFDAFREFSATYDAIIEDLTKNRLQIRKPEKPQGMFFLPIDSQPWVIHFVRSRIQEDTTFLDFLDLVIGGIEIMLQGVLLAVRDYILSTVKPAFDSAFEKIRRELLEGLTPPIYAGINSAFADAIPEVQAAIDRVSEWFVPIQEQQKAEVRPMENIVAIGIEATRQAHRGFSPIVDLDIDGIGIQSATSLSEFTDVLFTILDNVYCHSGNKINPHVKLSVKSGEQVGPRRRITVRVESEVRPRAYSEAAVAKLDRIRNLIESGEYRKHVNLEGGTGLLKLKRLVSVDERQGLDFGFAGENTFCVVVSLLLPSAEVEMHDDHAESANH